MALLQLQRLLLPNKDNSLQAKSPLLRAFFIAAGFTQLLDQESPKT